MAILINKTFETWTQEDIEAGDTDDRGFTFQDEPHTFRELIDEMKNYTQPSSSPCQVDSWLTSGPDENYITGENTYHSLHPANREPRTMRYWSKALKAAGFLP